MDVKTYIQLRHPSLRGMVDWQRFISRTIGLRDVYWVKGVPAYWYCDEFPSVRLRVKVKLLEYSIVVKLQSKLVTLI